jgi:hypothetical protein
MPFFEQVLEDGAAIAECMQLLDFFGGRHDVLVFLVFVGDLSVVPVDGDVELLGGARAEWRAGGVDGDAGTAENIDNECQSHC